MHAKATVNRIAAFDNMKWILIFLVVFAHILKNKSEFAPVLFGIYFFHMPAFIVISGCLSRKGKTEKDKAYSQVKLLLIYFVFNGVLMILFGRSNPNAIKPYYVMWYILCLVTWRLTSEKLSAIPNIMVVLVFAGLCCGIWKSIDNTFALSRMIAFFPFFMIGFIYKDAIIKLTLRKNGKEIIIGCIALLLAGIFGILSYHVFAFKIDD